MDITALTFYALICGVLSIFAPRAGTAGARFALGALVGIVAALSLPYLRATLGL